ncbi:MAG: ABC transporter permease [Myxococcales bacterium]|nr:ABC transporter permease [Myxococcales bacterium]MCB9647758.1 ABC transporter permease [Deltaproteobacteria bacterium]
MTRPRIITGLLLAVFLAMGVAGLLIDYGFVGVKMSQALELPGPEHLLGTDRLGRDLLPRVLVATRGFFLPGLLAAVIAAVLGVSLGAFAGYAPVREGIEQRPRWARALLDAARAVVKLALALPAALPRFVSIVLLCAAWGFEPFLIGAVAGVLYAAELGEDVRQRVDQCAHEEYVEAARSEGLSWARILGLHILWLHCRPLIVRHLVHLWSFVILVETSLSFIPGEFGIQEPDPSWGNMLVGARDPALTGHLWPSVVPTVAIVFTVVLLAWMGDRLSDPDDAAPAEVQEPAEVEEGAA